MPEGDTLHRIAVTLAKALTGEPVVKLSSPLPALAEAALDRVIVTRVEARGKNLLVHFDDGRCLHVHLRMDGSIHLYRPGERWKRPAWQARFVLETAGFVVVCFNAPVVELLAKGGVDRHEALRSLGPDLLDEQFDATEARRRLRELPDVPLGEAILRQSALAGIGNIFKSETLFLCKMDPFVTIASLDDASLDWVIGKARELMRRNLGSTPRRTRVAITGPRHWVYERTGKPCLVCGARIEVRRQGTLGRTTFYCARCQGVGSPGQR